MSRKLLLNDFKWVEHIYEFDESFRISYVEESNEVHFFKVVVQFPENLHNRSNGLLFLRERIKMEKVKRLN